MDDSFEPSGSPVAPVARQAPYLLFVFLLSVMAFAVLTTEALVDLKSETARVLRYADTLLCVLFFVDFLVCFSRAPNKVHYMITWGWLDLLSSIPAIPMLRWGRAARMVRVLQILRTIRSARILVRFILESRTQSAIFAAALSTVLAIAVSSVAILEFERAAGTGANIHTAEDAAWWSVVTLTTVGYGDYYPVTGAGRLVAVALMGVGVALIGTWAGIAASWFLAASAKQKATDLELLRQDINKIHQWIRSMSEGG